MALDTGDTVPTTRGMADEMKTHPNDAGQLDAASPCVTKEMWGALTELRAEAAFRLRNLSRADRVAVVSILLGELIREMRRG